MASQEAIVKHIDDIEGVPCPCGTSFRAFTSEDSDIAGVHVTHIRDASLHYHKRTTEYYYVLEGEGSIQLDDEEAAVRPGSVVMVPSGCMHAGRGDFKALIVTVPPFEADDEYVEQQE